MNCENCETQLLDLLYGELDATTVSQVRAHLDGCASCRAASEKLVSARRIVRQLPLESPPARVHAAIMARAQAHVRGEVVAAAPRGKAHAESEEPQSPVQRFMAWLGGFVLGPQVAMAMVLMLMVGVGLYYLPGLRTSRNVPGGAIVNADPGDEAGPSAAIQPAEPLDLRLDTRTNRLHSGTETVAARNARAESAADEAQDVVEGALPEQPAEQPAATLAALPQTNEARAGDVEAQGGEVIVDGLSDDSTGAELALAPGEAFGVNRAAAPRASSARQRDQLAFDVASPDSDSPAVAMQRNAPADTATARAPREALAEERSEQEQIAQAAPPPSYRPTVSAPTALAPPTTPSAVAPTPSTPSRAPAVPGRPSAMAGGPSVGAAGGSARAGMASGVGSTASAPANSAPQGQAQSPLLAAAGLHGVARNQARTSALREAISSYESLMSRYPSYDRATEAMLELAELYRRTGDLTRARSWLARAERAPAYAARARQQRFRIDEMDRARRAVPAAASPSSD